MEIASGLLPVSQYEKWSYSGGETRLKMESPPFPRTQDRGLSSQGPLFNSSLPGSKSRSTQRGRDRKTAETLRP